MNPWVKTGLWALALGVALYALTAVGAVVKVVLVSALLAYLLDPLVRMTEARGMGRAVATSVVFTGVAAAVGLLLYWCLPAAFTQMRALQSAVTPEGVAALIDRAERFLQTLPAFLGAADLDLSDSIRAFVAGHVRDAVTFVPDLLAFLGNLVLVPFLLFFILKDGPTLRKSFIAWAPNRYFEFVLNLLNKMDRQLGNYLRGKLITTLVVAALSTAALWVIGVDSYLILGVVAGLANLIPYIGPVFGTALAVAVSMLNGDPLRTGIAVVAAFIVVQLIDNLVLNPLVVARNVKLHPVTVLLVVIIGGKFFGVLGMLLAIPAAAVLKVAARETALSVRRYRFD
jgi:predicted PurR-regulated permease PerM